MLAYQTHYINSHSICIRFLLEQPLEITMNFLFFLMVLGTLNINIVKHYH